MSINFFAFAHGIAAHCLQVGATFLTIAAVALVIDHVLRRAPKGPTRTILMLSARGLLLSDLVLIAIDVFGELGKAAGIVWRRRLRGRPTFSPTASRSWH